jgi:pantetheine-phosphate adenylyltransferase
MHIYDILSQYFKEAEVDKLYALFETKLKEPWRKYHDITHVQELLDSYTGNSDIIYLTILYHDLVYFPWSDSNEYDSAELFRKHWFLYAENPDVSTMHKVYDLIMQTKDHSGTDALSKSFNKLDMAVLERDYTGLMRWEKGIRHEFGFAPTNAYKDGRINFLRKHVATYPKLKAIIDDVAEYKPRVGYYAGSFNPFHIGHLSIVRQAQKLFDKVVIVVAQNPDKTPDILEAETKAKNIFAIMGGIETVTLRQDEYLPDLLRERSQHEHPFLVRGIRNTVDWAYEDNQKQYMKAIWKDLDVMYLSCPKELEHISSTGIRSMNRIQPKSGDIYLPKKLLK